MKSLQHYEQPTFSDSENVFLQHYAVSGNRVDAMVTSGLATDPNQADSIELAAAQIIAKAETMPITAISSALGADKIMILAKIWQLAKDAEPKEAIKALFILARIHNMLGQDKATSKSVNLILNPPTPPPSTTTGLPFTLDLKP